MNEQTRQLIEQLANKCDDNAYYRIKPEPKRVPLEAGDIPAVCWTALDYGPGAVMKLVTGIACNGVFLYDGFTSFNTLMDCGASYSSDRKNWKPCWKELND